MADKNDRMSQSLSTIWLITETSCPDGDFGQIHKIAEFGLLGRMLTKDEPPENQTCGPDQRWCRAVLNPYSGSLRERLIAAWWVFSGHAYALRWPEPGEF